MSAQRDELITLTDAADRLMYSYQSVYNMAKAGKLPGAFQVIDGGVWRVKKDVFEAWFKTLGSK